MPNCSLIASCATVMMVPFIMVMKVVNTAREVSSHFSRTGQLYGLPGSAGPSQETISMLLLVAC